MTYSVRNLTIAVFLTFLLFLTPAVALTVSAQTGAAEPTVTETTETPGTIASIGTNFLKGVSAVWKTITGWISSLSRILGFSGGGIKQGDACESTAQCGKNLLCLNTCGADTGDCDTFKKLCVPGSADVVVEFKSTGRLIIKPEFAECGAEDLCSKNLICTRTCPSGADCTVTNRCLEKISGVGSCASDSDCQSVCGELPFAPIGVSAYRTSCENNQCDCHVEEVDPGLNITACISEAEAYPIICPSGTQAACTLENGTSKNNEPRLTCLTDPQFGGQCLNDDACSNVACAVDSTPFCDADSQCRCKKQENVTVSCQNDYECSSVDCPEGQISACFDSACTCEIKTQHRQDLTMCTNASECPADCQEGFIAACVESQCACQRTVENVPITCVAVEDCDSVSCPSDFEKACLNDQCACTRTTVQ